MQLLCHSLATQAQRQLPWGLGRSNRLRACLCALAAALPAIQTWAQTFQITRVTPDPRSTIVAGGGTVSVSWTGGTAPFQVQCRPTLTAPWQDVDGATSNRSVTNILLAPSAFYRVASVAATIAASPDRTAPSVPAGLAATASGIDQVNLTWNASTDSGSGATGVKGYNLYRNGVFLKQVPVGVTSASDTGLVTSTVYSYSISAVDYAYNQSARSSVVTVSTGVTINPGQLQWVRPAQGSSGFQVSPSGVAVDHSGNNIVAGGFIGTVDFGGGSVSSFNSSILRDIFVAKYTAQGTLSWFKHFGNFGNVLDNVAFCVAVDSQDNVVVSGAFQGTLDFGGAILSSAAGLDIFVVKYSASGSLLWAKRFGGAYDDVGRGVAIDSANNIILAASFQSPNTSFDGISLTPVGWADIALVKLSPAGATLWAKRYGSSGNEMPCSVAVDRSGDVVVAGDFFDTTDLGGGLVTSAGGSDFFLAKYSGADGSYRWSKTGGSANSDHAHCVTTDPNTGNVVVTGGFMGSANFGGGLVGGGSGGGLTLFLAGYGPLGNLLWLKTGGGDTAGDGDSGYGVKIDGSGNLALTGQFDSAMNFGTWPQDPWLLGKGYFVASFGISGDAMPTYRWTKRASGLQQSCGTAVALSSTGKVIPVGCFSGTVDFGGISATTSGPGVAGGFTVCY